MPKKRKKKQKARTKRSWIVDIPIGVCIFFVVVGVIIGNVFVMVIWHEGKLIDKSEAIPVAATFDSYMIHTSSKGSLNEVEMYFNDYEKLYIDGACFNSDVGNALNDLQRGEKVNLLLHPNSGDIWEMKSDENVMLSFDDAKMRMRSENIVFSAIFGIFGCLCAGSGIVSLLLKMREWRRRKN